MNANRTYSRFGVGLKWALPTAVYFAVAARAQGVSYPRFMISGLPARACAIAGCVLVLAGLAVYVAARVSLHRGLRQQRLVTTGPYALVRHPLYAASILLIIPGIVVAARSWLLLPTPVVAYVACRLLLPAEERKLLEQYGQEYQQYRERTSALFPIPKRRGKRP